MNAIEKSENQLAGFDSHSLEWAKTVSQSGLIPKAFFGKPCDVAIAVHVASLLKTSPFMIMNNLAVINGKPTLSANFSISLANSSGVFKAPINYEKSGNGRELVVTAYSKNHAGERIEATVSMKMAIQENWTKNPKYGSMPEHMLRYRAATFLIRQHAPQILLGMSTQDEAVEIQNSTPARTLNEVLKNEDIISKSEGPQGLSGNERQHFIDVRGAAAR